jgi:hypothetical protein
MPFSQDCIVLFVTAFNDSSNLFEYDVNNVKCIAMSDIGNFQEENQSTVSYKPQLL